MSPEYRSYIQTKDDFGNPMDDYTKMIYRGQR